MHPLEQLTIRQVPPSKILRMDLDKDIWTNPWTGESYSANDRPDFQRTFIHWGGGPNIAGEPIEEPDLTLREKVAVQFGRVRGVLRGWEDYHVRVRGNYRAIAYCWAIDPVFGRLYRLRGFRTNGGQYGHHNDESVAVVFVLGFGQSPSDRAWRTLGCMWVESGGMEIVPHRWANFDTPAQYQTSCPGDHISADIAAGRHIDALGLLKVRRNGILMRGQRVKSLARRLEDLGYNTRNKKGQLVSVYGRQLENVVKQVQRRAGLPDTGIVDRPTWLAIAG